MALEPDRIQKPLRKVRKLLKKMPALPTPEDIHDFRTSSRRVEEILQVLSLDSRGKGRRTAKALSGLRKRAGKVRDMDVLTSYATNLRHPHEEEERDCSVRLLEHLGAERHKYARKFHAVTQQSAAKLNKGLKRISNKVDKVLPAKNSAVSSKNAATSDVAAEALKLVSELASASRVGKSNLHSYRLKVKELQTLLKMADSRGAEFVNKLGEVKDAIGEWHDWEELVAIAGDVLDHGAACKLIRELKRTREQKYTRALALFQGTRRKYLREFDQRSPASPRHSLKRPAESVLSATAAIAA
jgi:CHAD domain-containing protein